MWNSLFHLNSWNNNLDILERHIVFFTFLQLTAITDELIHYFTGDRASAKRPKTYFLLTRTEGKIYILTSPVMFLLENISLSGCSLTFALL